jgi:hypothetical protein
MLFILLLSGLLQAQEICDSQEILEPQVLSLSQVAFKATEAFFIPLISFNVNHAGNGNISLLENPDGSIAAIRLNYENQGEFKSFILDQEQLKQGNRISMPGRNQEDHPPLQFYPVIPPGIDLQSGGEFKISIVTSQSPLRSMDYSVTLRKLGSRWILAHSGQRVRNMVLQPGINLFSSERWRGTFNKIEFRY